MKIERIKHDPDPEPMSLTEFAETYDLTLEVNERPIVKGSRRKFWVRFKRTEVKDRGLLIGETGDGPSEYVAIVDYVGKIAGRTIVFDAYGSSRQEIQVPRDLFHEQCGMLEDVARQRA
jgi:hypothetical protein